MKRTQQVHQMSVVESSPALPHGEPRQSPRRFLLVKGCSVDNATIERFVATTWAQATYVAITLEERAMLAKIRPLPLERKAEAIAAIDAIAEDVDRQRHNAAFAKAVSMLSEESFSRIWDNPKDAEYDNL